MESKMKKQRKLRALFGVLVLLALTVVLENI